MIGNEEHEGEVDNWKDEELGNISKIIDDEGIATGVLNEKEYLVGTPAEDDESEIEGESNKGIDVEIPNTPNIRFESTNNEDERERSMKLAVPPETEGFSTL